MLVINVDFGIIVISIVEFVFFYNLFDCFLVILEYELIELFIFLMKIDLLDDLKKIEEIK